ncbi:MAG: KTSC domain-containing protein [Acinetobacter populi]|jgi:hypothetical protein|uniref:KTSC domain-containing protein n=1 Tax=Acinetobacter populi TaxID=1582270 RepID=UPI00235616E6|nr:KTSC domain-containing protein [Acinetobacter populi]MCH4246289.1 KTSC domain-containing protein [Acinetobacter populi]
MRIFVLFILLLTTNAYAETVDVKYQGKVDLSTFQCNTPNSSFVHRICYQSQNQYVVVLLEDTYYHYCRVPSQLVNQWRNAQSKGRFYNQYLKGRYDCRLGGIPKI